MTEWDPALYLRFEAERTRPSVDLLARVPLDEVRYAVDLGCGPGNSTELLAARFEGADLLGVDTSGAMLRTARERLPQAQFELGDIVSWQPSRPPSLIFANAVLHWVPAHAELLPRLFSLLAPGGVLAIQMPDNDDEPSHRLIASVAAEKPWVDSLDVDAGQRTRLLPLGAYYDLLACDASHIDIWRTVYQHPMASAEAIVDWLRGTSLRPYLARLPPALQESFVAEFRRRIEVAYPPQADHLRLLAFPRLFIVAQRAQ